MLEGRGLNRHHQENHTLSNLMLIYMTAFYLLFPSCHSDLGKPCSCWDQWWLLIYFNSPAYRLLLSRRSCGLLSIVFITVYDPLKSREKLTRLICSSMQGKGRLSSASSLKRGLGEPTWIRSRPAAQPWCPGKPYPRCPGSTSEDGGSFVRGYVCFCLRLPAAVEHKEMSRLEQERSRFGFGLLSSPIQLLSCICNSSKFLI